MRKTPYYLIHKDILKEGMEKLKQAVAEYWPNAVIGYSFKTNALPWVLQYMKMQGCYAEVVSEDEYELAEYMQYENIIYNGPVKGKESFRRACKSGQIVNLDAFREQEWLRELCREHSDLVVKTGLRVNFDLEKACPGEASGGDEGGRFGFNYENGSFSRVLEELRRIPGVKVTGIHLHCSSKTRSLKIYEAIAGMACRIGREFQTELEYIDVGGGYFGGLDHKPQYRDYLRVMTEILKEVFDSDKTTLILEPGTSLICPPVEYVTTVTDVKETNRNFFAVTDGSRIHVDPLMSKKSYFYHVEPADDREQRDRRKKQVVSGFTCMENDRLFTMEDAPVLQVGDRIVYEKVGAYTMCLSPLFIGYFPPVYVEDQGKVFCVRQKWGVQEYVQQSALEGEGINLLILSCGTRNKIVQYAKKELYGRGRVIATDMSPNAPALYEADAHYLVPRITEQGYVDRILDICEKEQIRGVFSLIDPELSLLAENEERFRRLGVQIVGSSYELCERTLDKWQMYQWLKEHQYACARSYVDKEAFYKDVEQGLISYPVFVKPVRGSASIAITRADDRETVELLFSHGEGLLIQEYLTGQEIGVDCYIDLISKEVISIFAKKKLVMRAGETDKGISFQDPALFALVERFVKECGFLGQIDIDLFAWEGTYYISEVNPRFGGGYPHAYEAGVNHLKYIVRNLEGKTNVPDIGNYKEGVIMMKHNEVMIRNEEASV